MQTTRTDERTGRSWTGEPQPASLFYNTAKQRVNGNFSFPVMHRAFSFDVVWVAAVIMVTVPLSKIHWPVLEKVCFSIQKSKL
jgi:hypothetical protein